MNGTELIRELEMRFPHDAAEEWDNVGLLAGRADRDVRKIFVALDLTDETLEEAIGLGADMILTHHPLIFSPIRSVTDRDRTGRRIVTLLERGMIYYAMHTNYDVCAMADLNADQLELADREVLLVTGERDGVPEGIGRVGDLPREMTLRALGDFVREKMALPEVRLYGDPDASISRVAVSGGSGKGVVGDALARGAEALISSDLDYHEAIDAVADGMCFVDAGHYGTEHIFIEHMVSVIREIAPDCEVHGARIRHPFTVA